MMWGCVERHGEWKECPACRAKREEAKRVIEERVRGDREEQDRLMRHAEDWLREQSK
jgi:hypothetical protein